MNRGKVALIGLVYLLAIAALLLAANAVIGLRPNANTTQPTAAGRVDGNIPTLRPIWPAGTSAARPTSTPTPTPTPTPIPAPARPSAIPTATARSAITSRPSTGTASLPPHTATIAAATAASTPLASTSIKGLVLMADAAPTTPLTITLETTGYAIIASTRTAADGSYVFAHIPDRPDGYNIVFSLEANPGLQGESTKYATWAWLGPVRLNTGDVNVPRFDIALLAIDPQTQRPVQWQPDTPQHTGQTIQFSWPAISADAGYWLDIARGENLDTVWQSPLQTKTRVSWNGLDTRGQPVAGGYRYYWAVGARRTIAPGYMLTTYSHFIEFTP